MNKTVIDITRAITPPSLFRIDHRIAYVNKKYDSGWMCTGFTRGFARVKLSGSLKLYGSFRVSTAILSDYCNFNRFIFQRCSTCILVMPSAVHMSYLMVTPSPSEQILGHPEMEHT